MSATIVVPCRSIWLNLLCFCPTFIHMVVLHMIYFCPYNMALRSVYIWSSLCLYISMVVLHMICFYPYMYGFIPWFCFTIYIGVLHIIWSLSTLLRLYSTWYASIYIYMVVLHILWSLSMFARLCSMWFQIDHIYVWSDFLSLCHIYVCLCLVWFHLDHMCIRGMISLRPYVYVNKMQITFAVHKYIDVFHWSHTYVWFDAILSSRFMHTWPCPINIVILIIIYLVHTVPWSQYILDLFHLVCHRHQYRCIPILTWFLDKSELTWMFWMV